MNYSQFWGLTLNDALKRRLGTVKPVHVSLTSVKHRIDRLVEFTEEHKEFDARRHWPGDIGLSPDQGDCGSSWVYSTVGQCYPQDTYSQAGQANQAGWYWVGRLSQITLLHTPQTIDGKVRSV